MEVAELLELDEEELFSELLEELEVCVAEVCEVCTALVCVSVGVDPPSIGGKVMPGSKPPLSPSSLPPLHAMSVLYSNEIEYHLQTE